MVKALLTSNCESHHTNQNYTTLLILFDGNETNVRPLGLRGNWQPTDAELQSIIRLLANISPTFREWLINYGNLLEFNKPVNVPTVEKPKPVTELAELLL